MFVKAGKTFVNMEKVEVVSNLEGEGDVALRMDSGIVIKVAGQNAKSIRSLILGDDDAEIMDDDYMCNCPRCMDLKDALIDALLALEPQSKTIQ